MRILTISLIAVILLATVGLGWMFDNVYQQYVADEQIQNKDAINILEELGGSLAYSINQIDNKAQFISNWNTQNSYSLNLVQLKEFPLPAPLLESIKSGKPLPLETEEHLSFHYYLQLSDEILILKSPITAMVAANQNINLIFTIGFYGALLVLFLVWLYPLIKRLIILRNTAKAFGHGDLDKRVKISSLSYIKDIELEFNHMAQRIGDLVNDVKLLSSAVSHDLRTPLARIRFGIDTLAEEDDPELQKKYHEKISDNVDEMSSLVETLLNYARLDSAMLEIKKEVVDLDKIVQKSIKNKVTEGIEINFESSSNHYFVNGDSAYLTMLFNNVLQNAINYGDKKVSVQLIKSKDKVKIIVSDDGKGISEEHREEVLKPFVRANNESTNLNQTVIKGHGVGLAIVKRILDWHQGTIKIKDAKVLSGAMIEIELPSS